MILYPWLGAHLALGYLGYLAYYNDTTKTFDALYDEFKASFADREEFDEMFITDEMLEQDVFTGFSRSRLVGFVSAGLSLAGTAATFLAPAIVFQALTFGSTLTSAYVVSQALAAEGWYEDMDPALSDIEVFEEYNPEYKDSKNYLLFGGLAAFATNAVVLVMMFMGGPADAPAPEALPPTTEDEAATVELSLW
jgi:hypothetical protein